MIQQQFLVYRRGIMSTWERGGNYLSLHRGYSSFERITDFLLKPSYRRRCYDTEPSIHEQRSCRSACLASHRHGGKWGKICRSIPIHSGCLALERMVDSALISSAKPFANGSMTLYMASSPRIQSDPDVIGFPSASYLSWIVSPRTPYSRYPRYTRSGMTERGRG